MSKPILMTEKGKLIRGAVAMMRERLKAHFEREIQRTKKLEFEQQQKAQKKGVTKCD